MGICRATCSLVVRIVVINMAAVIVVVKIAFDICHCTMVYRYVLCIFEERHGGWMKTKVMVG